MKIHVLPPVLRWPGDLILLELTALPVRARFSHSCAWGTTDSGWRVRRRSLLRAPVPGPLRGLEGAWSRLASATCSAATLADLLEVLLGTIHPGGAAAPIQGPLFQGKPCDVRASLCHPAAVQAMLLSLEKHLPAALGLLRRRGGPTTEPSGGWDALAAPAELPPVLATGLLPWLGGTRPSPVLQEAGLALVWGADPDRQGLLAEICRQGGSAWLPVVAAEPADSHGALLRLLLETRAILQMPPPRIHRLFKALRCLSDVKTWRDRARWAGVSLAAGAGPDTVASCLRYHLQHRLPLPELNHRTVKPEASVLHLLLRRADPSMRRRPDRIWHFLSADPAVTPAVRRIFAGGSREPRWQMDLVILLADTKPLDSRSGGRRALLISLLPWLLELAGSMKAGGRYHCMDLLEEWIMDSPASYEGLEEDLLHWLPRLAAFEGTFDWRILQFMNRCLALLPRGERQLLQTWTTADLKYLAKRGSYYSFSTAASDSLVPGIIPTAFLAWALRFHLKPMLELLLTLGHLPETSIRRVWETFARHPLLECPAASLTPRRALVLLDSVAAGHEGMPPLPDSVRRLIVAEEPSDSPRWQDARAHLTALHGRLACEVLDRLVQWECARGFPGLTRGENVAMHTLRMVRSNQLPDENAQAYRRIVRAGDGGYATRAWALSLPLNLPWLARHPAARHPAWTEGFPFEVTLPKAGIVTLAPENDLQEILRMGTRFHTCLSVGGCNSHSPAAVALDANKRVVIARDGGGKVLARQLLAISEDGSLVCFTVYAHRDRAELRGAFATYDHMLAQVLRLPLWQSREDYDVAPLVCRHWYDDGAWLLWKESVEMAS